MQAPGTAFLKSFELVGELLSDKARRAVKVLIEKAASGIGDEKARVGLAVEAGVFF